MLPSLVMHAMLSWMSIHVPWSLLVSRLHHLLLHYDYQSLSSHSQSLGVNASDYQ